MRALFDANHEMRNMVVPYEKHAEITIRKALQEMVELNEGQPRDTLVKMLEEALEE